MKIGQIQYGRQIAKYLSWNTKDNLKTFKQYVHSWFMNLGQIQYGSKMPISQLKNPELSTIIWEIFHISVATFP